MRSAGAQISGISPEIRTTTYPNRRRGRQADIGELPQVGSDEFEVARRLGRRFERCRDLDVLDTEDATELDPKPEVVDELFVARTVQETFVALEGVENDANEAELARALVDLPGRLAQSIARIVEALERLGVVLWEYCGGQQELNWRSKEERSPRDTRRRPRWSTSQPLRTRPGSGGCSLTRTKHQLRTSREPLEVRDERPAADRPTEREQIPKGTA